MSGPSDHRFDLNFDEEAAMPSQDNIWRPSFLSLTGPLTVGDSVMKNDMTATVVARNFLTPKDNRLLSKRSDELAIKDYLGEAFVGEAFVGQAFVGQAFVGQAFVGQAFVGEAFVGQAFVGEAFMGQAFELKLCR
ncbi:hypothetical protein FF2_006591 [Malus domestica]